MHHFGEYGNTWAQLLSRASLWVLLAVVPMSAQSLSIKSQFRPGDLPLVHQNKIANIIYSRDDHKVVQIAASHLALDIERVTGKKPPFAGDIEQIDTAIIIGTLGKSTLIDRMAASGKLDVSKIRGKWESFIITTVQRPTPNIKRALVIAGSDRRGTAFGVYELSQMIGVSPWYWWADVTSEKKTSLYISQGTFISREPSVKYRGIFINDEDWGLQPWAAKTFEPETGDMGPKTYAKVFELLLRLKANTLWPAMHEVTKPFNFIAGNAQMADDHAIVMGSSHAEPMLRNNVGEWKANKDDYNFVTNPGGVTEYWDKRANENRNFESIYTLGMRGIHDSPLIGTRSQAERIPLLEKIFSVQRGLIAKHVNPNVEAVPQIFCPYKEVLADYRAGLKVPEDVTIVFPDDNFGYIRQFPTAEEQKRKGGFGVYYHISYLGRPLSYLWLNTTPPTLIWQEMSKAYENGMRNLWIVNVGDIKPGEIGMEFFLQMAYDADRWNVGNQKNFLGQFAKREFGEKDSREIADVLDKYYRLSFQRKPEHLQWHLPTEPVKKSDLTEDETIARLNDFHQLRKQAEHLYTNIAANKRDAFYQLVLYPVRSAAYANLRFFAAELAQSYRSASPSAAREMAKSSIWADNEISRETKFFNEILAGGKWRHMMSPEMGPGQWPSMRTTAPKPSLADHPFDGPEEPNPIEEFRPLKRSGPGPDLSVESFSIEAERFDLKRDKGDFGWRVIEGLGKTGDSISVLPNTAFTFSNILSEAPYVDYVFAAAGGEYSIEFHLLPTHPIKAGQGVRLAYSIDNGDPQLIVVDRETEVSSRKWAQNILNQATIGEVGLQISKGEHRLRIFAVDTGVVLDKIVVSAGTSPQSYFGP